MQRKRIALLFAGAVVMFALFCAGYAFGRDARGAVVSVGEPIVRQTAEEHGQLDLNTATADELKALPGIGEKLAAAILAFREENGPFRSVWMLEAVNGIGQAKIEAILPYVTVKEPG